MPKFYATTDSDGGYISEDAYIVVFATEQEAREYLLRGYDPEYWNLESSVIETGSWGDCWTKSLNAPRVGEPWLLPFSYTQVHVQRPGQHPGGKEYWTTPKVDVLVLSRIEER